MVTGTTGTPTEQCPQCGAMLAARGRCEDYFHELLALESLVPGAAGEVPHFLAVASYNLQHPLGFMPTALAGLRTTLGDVLAGRATVADARRRARYSASGPTRVRRHADQLLSEAEQASLDAWPRAWPMTVLDVCRVPPEQYVAQVRAWAESVSAMLRHAR